MGYSFMENKDFVLLSTGRGRGIIRRDFDNEELRRALENINKLFDSAEIFKDSRTTKAGITKIQGRDVFVKSFNNKGFVYSIRYIFRKPRPFRVCRAAWALKQAGVPTPQPIAAFAEFLAGFFPKNAFLIREVVPDVIDTLTFFEIMLPQNELRHEFIQSACELFSKMHNAGVYHGDAKCSNIYVSKNDSGSYNYGVWDLLSCKLEKKSIDTTLRHKEIARFANSFAEIAGRLELELPEDATEENIFKIYNNC